jgi:hypothetical protein
MAALQYDRRAFLWALGAVLGAMKSSACAAMKAQAPDDVASTLSLRLEELQRRINSLPVELSRWKTRAVNELDQNLHFSQIESLRILMEAFVEDETSLMQALDPHGNPDVFLEQSFGLVFEIIRAQRVWDFYRDKLQLRFSPDFKDSLRTADIVAWDCYLRSDS